MSAMFKTPFSTMWWLGVPLMFFLSSAHLHVSLQHFSKCFFYQKSCWCYLTSQLFCMLCGPVVVTTGGGRGVDVHNTAIIKSRHNCTVVFTSRKWETGFVSIQKSNFTLQFSCQVLHTGPCVRHWSAFFPPLRFTLLIPVHLFCDYKHFFFAAGYSSLKYVIRK